MHLVTAEHIFLVRKYCFAGVWGGWLQHTHGSIHTAAPSSHLEYLHLDVCHDSCATAKDGICQEGRPGVGPGGFPSYDELDLPHRVFCDLGTDCSDCGPWRFKGPKDALFWTPVRDLQKENVG